MTIIIALAHEDGVTIGSDRFSCHGNIIVQRNKVKWLELEDGFWVASSGVADIREILLTISSDPESDCNLLLDCSPFVFCSELRKRLRDVEHWSGKNDEHGGPAEWNVSLLMTDGESVWETTNTLYPILVDQGEPISDGSGWAFALGAMYAERRHQVSGQHMLGMARAYSIVSLGIEAAIYYDLQCGGEPWIELVTKKDSA